LAELAAAGGGLDLPGIFIRDFTGNDETPGWFDAFSVYLAWHMQSNTALWIDALFAEVADTPSTNGDASLLFDRVFTHARETATRLDRAANSAKVPLLENGAPSKLLEHIKENLSTDYERFAPLVRQLHITQKTPLKCLFSLTERLEERKCPPPAFPTQLRNMIEAFGELINILSAPCTYGPTHAQLKYMVGIALGNGRFDDAECYLKAGEKLLLNLGRGQVATEPLASALYELRMLLSKVYDLQGTYMKAAATTQKAALSLPRDDYDRLYECLRGSAIALGKHGDEQDEPKAMLGSIEANQGAIALLPKLTIEVDTADLYQDIALMFMGLNRLEGGTKHLDDAVISFEQALGAVDEEAFSDRWAALQSQLANALTLLGNRGADDDMLKRAAQVHELLANALERNIDPVKWSIANKNRADVLKTIGRRKKDPAMFDAAISAYRQALEELTKAGNPGPLAWCQTGLAEAYLELAELGGGDQLILSEEARDLLNSALDVFIKKSHPGPWTNVQFRLGQALKLIGTETRDVQALTQSIEAFKNAAEETSEQKTPPRWVELQFHIGETALDLYEVTGQADWYDVAEKYLGQALDVAEKRKFIAWINRTKPCLARLEVSQKAHQ